jgi:glucosyl-3-phosphoglycerate synthase
VSPAPIVRTWHHAEFPEARLRAAKRGRSISVCLPARDEAATIGPIVRVCRDLRPLVDEVVVVDDGSTDDTGAVALAAGARVVAAADVLPECGPGSGKGEALWKSIHAAHGDLIVWCDADVRNFSPRFVTGLVGPLLSNDDVSLVKGFYDRPLDGRPGEGGRVTELVARPLISILFPHLAAVVQPLGGECAGRREVLEQLPFVQGYGVDLALLVDVAERFGLGAMAQVDLGVRVHRNRPLAELAPQAEAIIATALTRAGLAVTVEVGARPPMIEVPAYRKSA